nr:MAG: hypothetical protein H1Bulk292190_000002 [Astroviridae sp.]
MISACPSEYGFIQNAPTFTNPDTKLPNEPVAMDIVRVGPSPDFQIVVGQTIYYGGCLYQLSQPGDSGGAVYWNGKLFGMTQGISVLRSDKKVKACNVIPINPAWYHTKFDSKIADLVLN